MTDQWNPYYLSVWPGPSFICHWKKSKDAFSSKVPKRPVCRYIAKIYWMDVLKPPGSFVSCSLHDDTRPRVFMKYS